eukprot:TRINITY_DN10651_c0_g1_i2.p1 TRINITY_DN10651_c0_g1~~TRINITY_DN10651_c0_g1_i2.p1  ORF type:complete len:559 (+),score=70.56 TRINITY_DN10651_c0_g1_i2:1-1677(+)
MQGSKNTIDFWLKNEVGLTSGFRMDYFIKTMALLILLNILFTVSRSVMTTVTALRASKDLFSRLNKNIVYSKMKFFDQNTYRENCENRISKDILEIDDQVPWSLANLFAYGGGAAGLLVGIMIQLPYIIIIIIIVGFLFSRVRKRYRALLREVTRLSANNNSKTLSHITETASGLVTIRAFKKESKFIRDFLTKIRDQIFSGLIISSLNYWSSIRLEAISLLLFMAVALASYFGLVYNFIEQYSTIALVLAYVLLLTEAIADTIYFVVYSEKCFISVERVSHYLRNDIEDLNKVNRPVNLSALLEPFLGCSIVFDEVKMSYNEPNDPNIKYALNGVSFKVKRGERIAFCGRTGSGKTSILNALFRLYDISGGAIYVAGQNIAHISLSQLRKSMAVIPQFGILFQSTLRDNLDPVGTKKADEIKQVIDKAGFKIRGVNRDFKDEDKKKEAGRDVRIKLKESPKKSTVANSNINIDYEIEKSGRNLSNGEKQIINFLRILLRDTQIFCLDEAGIMVSVYLNSQFSTVNLSSSTFSNQYPSIPLDTHKQAVTIYQHQQISK